LFERDRASSIEGVRMILVGLALGIVRGILEVEFNSVTTSAERVRGSATMRPVSRVPRRVAWSLVLAGAALTALAARQGTDGDARTAVLIGTLLWTSGVTLQLAMPPAFVAKLRRSRH
jgi:hypothetical protein